MYIGFDLKIKLEDYIIESSDEIEKWKKIGQEYNAEIKENADDVLKKYVNGEIVNGSALSAMARPFHKLPVLLQYLTGCQSYNDGLTRFLLSLHHG